MELFFAQNHSAMTHLPIAAAILLAAVAMSSLFTSKREIVLACALLTLIAFATSIPTIITGVAAAKGRMNEEGKPYLASGVLVPDTSSNIRVFRHETLGVIGFGLSVILAILGISGLRGRWPNKYLLCVLALALALCWGIGGHLGGKELWGPDTFPGLK